MMRSFVTPELARVEVTARWDAELHREVDELISNIRTMQARHLAERVAMDNRHHQELHHVWAALESRRMELRTREDARRAGTTTGIIRRIQTHV